MIKFILKSILGIIILAALAIAYGIYSYKSKAEKYVEELVLLSAKQSGVNVAFEEFQLNLIGAKAKNLGIYLPKAFLNFNLSEPKVNLPILSAIMMSPAVDFSAKFYDSEIGGRANFNINQRTTGGSLKLDNLDLGKVQELKIVGVTGGNLNLNFDNLRIKPTGPEFLEGKFSLKNLATNTERKFPIYVNKQVQELRIPAINSLSSEANILFENNVLSLKDGSLNSDIGNAKYGAEITYNPKGGMGNLAFHADVNLSGKGLQYFGYLLPQISNNILNETQSRFTFKIDGSTRNLKYSFFTS